jgi:NAD(P)-dependent dehydrogenase (short-subunit alcohol dehydrogenase family)
LALLLTLPISKRWNRQSRKQFVLLDVVFANAKAGDITPLGASRVEQFELVLRTNITGAFFTVQAALLNLSDEASVILNSSVHVTWIVPGFAAYAASKTGLSAIARCVASESSPLGIKAKVVVPGPTRMFVREPRVPNVQAMETLEARLSQAMPLGRLI